MSEFKSTVLMLPGLGNSGDGHWQSIWEGEHGFKRVEQTNWDTPVLADWIANLEQALNAYGNDDVILVGHSLACSLIGHWSLNTKHTIKAALLVAPSDTEASSFPAGTSGFIPMPTHRLHFRSITVTSTNDFYVTTERAQYFAKAWESELIVIQDAGHINVASGFGPWQDGLHYLKRLDS